MLYLKAKSGLDKLSIEVRHNMAIQMYENICINYVPKFYLGKWIFFMANDSLEAKNPMCGWDSEYIAVTRKTHIVAGNHLSMLTVHTTALANQLMKCCVEIISNT